MEWSALSCVLLFLWCGWLTHYVRALRSLDLTRAKTLARHEHEIEDVGKRLKSVAGKVWTRRWHNTNARHRERMEKLASIGSVGSAP